MLCCKTKKSFQIRNIIHSLSPAKRNIVITHLTNEARKSIVNVFKNKLKDCSKASLQMTVTQLQNILTDTTCMKRLQITRKENRPSFVGRIIAFVKWLFEEIKCLFGKFSSRYTRRIIDHFVVQQQLLRHSKCQQAFISKSALLELLKSPVSNLKNELISRGYAPVIAYVDILTLDALKDTNFDGISFIGVKIDWSHFSRSHLKNVRFENCTLYNVSFNRSVLDNCHFIQCTLQEVMFVDASIKYTSFDRTDLLGCSFEDARLQKVLFRKSSMPGTHFLQASMDHCRIVLSDLLDTVFFGTDRLFEHIDAISKQSLRLTKPIGALICPLEKRGISMPKAFIKIEESAGLIPIRISGYPSKVNNRSLNNEVHQLLLSTPKKQLRNIIRSIVKDAQKIQPSFPNCKKILEKSIVLSKHSHAILLPGGEDIPPTVYGQTVSMHSDWDGDYKRTILEGCLINHCVKRGIPIMGICRGFQLACIYFGSQLTQHVVGQSGLQEFDSCLTHQKGLYGDIFKDGLMGAVHHHQAVEEIGFSYEFLHPTVIRCGLVKAAEPGVSAAAPAILLQFHPEFLGPNTADDLKRELADYTCNTFLSEQNNLFWKVLGESAITYHRKKSIVKAILKKFEFACG